MGVQRPHVRNQLALFFRDELISWAWRRPPSAPGPPSVSGANMSVAELRAKVSINVESILRRLNRIAPQNYVEMLLLRQVGEREPYSTLSAQQNYNTHNKRSQEPVPWEEGGVFTSRLCPEYPWGPPSPSRSCLVGNRATHSLCVGCWLVFLACVCVLGRTMGQNQEAAGSAEGGAGPWSIQEGVVGLVEVAMKPENLCMMDPTWMPWF